MPGSRVESPLNHSLNGPSILFLTELRQALKVGQLSKGLRLPSSFSVSTQLQPDICRCPTRLWDPGKLRRQGTADRGSVDVTRSLEPCLWCNAERRWRQL